MKLRELSASEVEALRLYALGNSSRDIAKSLEVHQSTVLNHLRVAARKLHAKNLVHGAVIASEIGLFRVHQVRAPAQGSSSVEKPLPAASGHFEESVRMRAFEIWV